MKLNNRRNGFFSADIIVSFTICIVCLYILGGFISTKYSLDRKSKEEKIIDRDLEISLKDEIHKGIGDEVVKIEDLSQIVDVDGNPIKTEVGINNSTIETKYISIDDDFGLIKVVKTSMIGDRKIEWCTYVIR